MLYVDMVLSERSNLGRNWKCSWMNDKCVSECLSGKWCIGMRSSTFSPPNYSVIQQYMNQLLSFKFLCQNKWNSVFKSFLMIQAFKLGLRIMSVILFKNNVITHRILYQPCCTITTSIRETSSLEYELYVNCTAAKWKTKSLCSFIHAWW